MVQGFDQSYPWPEVCFICPETTFLCRLHAFVSACARVLQPQRYQNETKIALPLGQSEAHLACALLFVPPMIPSCDVKAAIQHRAKGNSWPLCISSLYKPLFLRHPECSVWQSCAFHAWVTWLNGGNQMLFPEWSPRQTSPSPRPLPGVSSLGPTASKD